MPTERLVNNGQTLVAEPYLAGGTTLQVVNAAVLPAIGSGEVFHVIAYTPDPPAGVRPNAEVMRVTAVSGDVLTVVSAAEPVAGVQQSFDHGVGDVVANALTVESLTNLITQIVGGLSAPRFAWNETPSGTIDGTNPTFTLANAPTGESLQLVSNGVVQTAGHDFTLAGSTITFFPGAVPQAGDPLSASYTY